MTEPSGTAAKADEKLYLNLKEVHKMCYEKGIKNVIKKQKKNFLRSSVSALTRYPVRYESISAKIRNLTSGVTTDYESIYRCGKDLGISLRTLGRYLSKSKNKGEPEKFMHCSKQLEISHPR